MLIRRRSLLGGLLAIPSIVRSGSLMKVSKPRIYTPDMLSGLSNTEHWYITRVVDTLASMEQGDFIKFYSMYPGA